MRPPAMKGGITLYRGMKRAALDAAYNNSAAVADSSRLLADFQTRSDQLRAARQRQAGARRGGGPPVEICAKHVSSPCPCAEEPVRTVTLPVG